MSTGRLCDQLLSPPALLFSQANVGVAANGRGSDVNIVEGWAVLKTGSGHNERPRNFPWPAIMVAKGWLSGDFGDRTDPPGLEHLGEPTA
jgi:hypothetical protein